MTDLERLLALRGLRSRIDAEIVDLEARLAVNGTPAPQRPTRLETITEDERNAFLADVEFMKRRRLAGWLKRRPGAA